MKKLLSLGLIGVLVLSGCGSSNKEEKSNEKVEDTSETKTEEKKEPSFEDTVVFGDLEITFHANVSFTTVENQFSEHDGKEVVVVPVTIKNIGTETSGLNMFYVKVYGSQGQELSDVSTYFSEADVLYQVGSDSLRAGASADSNLHFIYDGNGDYYVSFKDYSSKVEIKLAITK